ncbi:MAG: purine-nucleoside phosphorylase [Reinekea forsetii]|jgi:purine-nucleoside phosphorylase|uniref:purine-nucleoside phosphorylase n=1 Tax=Reinekea TaxID=230494 RepID=UPI002354ECE7|nr:MULTISPECIES: purine-nucleoside phosphorylase [Reinekea]MDO7642070.1 purine-nucleoside phosphorylase [Reinekea forsetii]MDO7645794.1 purine-nucleoside phosphorylase [Reinekea forsetii]MDO7674886.1 purine-nucleoside phosphorylase [Reinekea forsetii]
MATPHIKAELGDFAETVLMPGDPLRAQHIAETFLSNVVRVNDVRNMFAYTGEYKGKRLSVMGSGMGIPSISIYAKELITELGVKNIIRVGTCGALADDIQLRDVIVAMGASTDSGVNRARLQGYDFSAIASYPLLEATVNAARDAKIEVRVGNVFSADLFYTPVDGIMTTLAGMGILAVEMETAGLYGVAAEYGANALAVMTVSDHILRGEAASADERQNTFNDMIEITLNAAITL